MKLLLASATPMEISPSMEAIKHFQNIDVLITGIGIAASTWALTRQLLVNKYDFVLQAGVGGSFDTSLRLGELVFIHQDQFGDLGAEDHNHYLDIFDLGLMEKNIPPFIAGTLPCPPHHIHDKITLPRVTGLTVNTVSGSEPTISRRKQKFGCTMESMEGAALHFVCLQEKIPFAQVRAISNYVTPRDRSSWKMKEAITNLNEWLKAFCEGF